MPFIGLATKLGVSGDRCGDLGRLETVHILSVCWLRPARIGTVCAYCASWCHANGLPCSGAFTIIWFQDWSTSAPAADGPGRAAPGACRNVPAPRSGGAAAP